MITHLDVREDVQSGCRPFERIMTAVAVIDLVTDASRYCVCDVAVTLCTGSAKPKPADQTGCPSSAIAIESAGAR